MNRREFLRVAATIAIVGPGVAQGTAESLLARWRRAREARRRRAQWSDIIGVFAIAPMYYPRGLR